MTSTPTPQEGRPLLTALDLSLTATGLFHGDPTDPTYPCLRAEIATPQRRTNESDSAWNGRRFDVFSGFLMTHCQEVRPRTLVMEVTGHAHQWQTRGETRTQTSRGQEFRAGLGLGRALGWIDGWLVLARAYGLAPAEVATIEAREIKMRVAGAEGASKAAVRARLAEIFGWDTRGWRESEVDALACGLGWLRTRSVPAVLRAPRRRTSGAASRAALP